MLKKLQQLGSIILAMSIILSLFFTNTVQAANKITNIQNESTNLRTNLTFLEGTPGDSYLIYTYIENGQKYKVIEYVDDEFMNVKSKVYCIDSNNNYIETKSQTLNNQTDNIWNLTNTDINGNSEFIQIDTIKSISNSYTHNDNLTTLRDYTDPGTGEWRTHVWDGSSNIYNMTISAIMAVIGAAIDGKTGAALWAIASDYFKRGSDYAYYHVVDNIMMSKLYPMTVILREATDTTYYLDAGHNYPTGSDYYEYDGRW